MQVIIRPSGLTPNSFVPKHMGSSIVAICFRGYSCAGAFFNRYDISTFLLYFRLTFLSFSLALTISIFHLVSRVINIYFHRRLSFYHHLSSILRHSFHQPLDHPAARVSVPVSGSLVASSSRISAALPFSESLCSGRDTMENPSWRL